MVTVRELARIAGVSPSTVSRAMTQPHLVAPARRAAILRLAAELDYAGGREGHGGFGATANIALVVPDIENPVFAAVVKGAQQRARRGGYAVFIADSEEDAELEAELVTVLSKQVDGLVLFSPRMPPEALAEHAAKMPIVLVNRVLDDVDSIVFDNAEGMRYALEHLHALGHRRVAYIAGPRDSWSNQARTEGLHAAEAELEGIELIELGHVAPVFQGGVASADRAVASGATAVVCYNDLVALGVLSRLAHRRISVPEEMSVIGFDDVPAATLVSPALTTLAVPMRQLGRDAFDRLLTLIKEPDTKPTVQMLPANLIVRSSTAAARSA
jgi:DNA-binding LacI/PurR family transcriptional regulator